MQPLTGHPKSPHPQSTPHLTLPRAGHTNIKYPHDICLCACSSLPRATQHTHLLAHLFAMCHPGPLALGPPLWDLLGWLSYPPQPVGVAAQGGFCRCHGAHSPTRSSASSYTDHSGDTCVFMLSLVHGMSAPPKGKDGEFTLQPHPKNAAGNL